MIVASTSKDSVATLKARLFKGFNMKDLGVLNHIFEMQVIRDKKKNEKGRLDNLQGLC